MIFMPKCGNGDCKSVRDRIMRTLHAAFIFYAQHYGSPLSSVVIVEKSLLAISLKHMVHAYTAYSTHMIIHDQIVQNGLPFSEYTPCIYILCFNMHVS